VMAVVDLAASDVKLPCCDTAFVQCAVSHL